MNLKKSHSDLFLLYLKFRFINFCAKWKRRFFLGVFRFGSKLRVFFCLFFSEKILKNQLFYLAALVCFAMFVMLYMASSVYLNHITLLTPLNVFNASVNSKAKVHSDIVNLEWVYCLYEILWDLIQLDFTLMSINLFFSFTTPFLSKTVSTWHEVYPNSYQTA